MTDLAGKYIVVTGGNGFLGRHVCRLLEDRGPKRLDALRKSDADLTIYDGARYVMACRPDVVIHLAAVCGGIGVNRSQPARFLHENSLMALNVLEACRLAGVEKVVTIGSCCAYPKNCPVPFKEDDLWAGYPEETNAGYGIAKRLLLELGQAYRRQYGLNVIHLIPANLYGPGDNFDEHGSHVIPAVIRKAVEAKAVGLDHLPLWGTGKATRDFLFVEDAAAAIVLAAERYDGAEPVNIGTGKEIAIDRLAALVCRATGFEGEVRFDSAMPDGQPRRCLDVSRARERFGWEAVTPLEDGLEKTVLWYQENLVGAAG